MIHTRIQPKAFLIRALCVLAAAAALASPRLAHAAPEGAAAAASGLPSDMKLWSFGDCDRQFPYADSDEHTQCVRVVGSEEARDARAFRVCDKSHQKDREEAARCKAAYSANKQRAAQHGLVPNAAAQNEPPAPEMLDKVRAITAAAVDYDRAAAVRESPANAAPPELTGAQPAAGATAPEPEDSFSPVSIMRAMAPIFAIVGSFLIIRRQREKSTAKR